MKAYLYFSKNKIFKINHVDIVKESVAEALSDSFNLFEKVTMDDVSVRCAQISNDIDVFFVLNKMITDTPKETVRCMQILKEKLYQIIQTDQEKTISYNIKTKIDESHVPLGNDYRGTDNMADSNGIAGKSDKGLGLDYADRAKAYIPVEPAYSFDRVILPEDVLEKIESAINILRYERKVFDEWGLYEIQPNPSSSLSFFGPSGTGKTMAAEAIAQKLGKKILKVSYADVESKYHGEGPKMVKAIFLAAENEDAVLFFDEADSLLSKRLTNVSQGSEQAINSMRSQLLICLEEFKGIVIFATNLVVNYDSAFLTRLISIEFKRPDIDTRKKIWDVHVKSSANKKLNIPLASDVNTNILAEKYDFAGREIRNAVIAACVSAAMQERNIVIQNDFIKACDKIVEEKASVANASDHTVSNKSKEIIKQAIADKIKEGGMKSVSTTTE